MYGKENTYRAFVFDHDSGICSLFQKILDRRKYEVFTFPYSGVCPINEMTTSCPIKTSCTDIIISDTNMSIFKELEFITEQMKKKCLCKNIAFITGNLEENTLNIVEKFGYKIFTKPLQINGLNKWLTEVEKRIDPNRILSDSWKEKYC